MPALKEKPSYLILAGKQPPQIYRFQRHKFWWFRRTNSLLEALGIAQGLALIDIHGIIKKCHGDKILPFIPTEPYFKAKSQHRERTYPKQLTSSKKCGRTRKSRSRARKLLTDTPPKPAASAPQSQQMYPNRVSRSPHSTAR